MASQSSQRSTYSSEESSQGKKLSEQDLQTIVNATVVFILSYDHSKYTLKRQDIVKHCFKTYGRLYKTIMDEVKTALREVFGMDLVELDPNTNNKQYILINCKEFVNQVDDLKWSDETEAQQILLMLVLSHIFMSGGVVPEDFMWNFLSQLDIITNSRCHEYFGDVRKLMTQEFVRQLYLDYCRVPESDPPRHEFRWGRRSEEEVSQREILNFVSELHGTGSIEKWTSHYNEVKKSEARKGLTENFQNEGSSGSQYDDDLN